MTFRESGSGTGPGVLPLVFALPAGGTALVCGDQAVSYTELETLVSGLTRELSARGATRGSRIGVCLRRGIWSIAAMLATWRTGGTYIPLDPAFPPERLRYMISEAAVTWTITDTTTTPAAAALGTQPIPVETAQPAPAAAAPGTPPHPHDLAYIIFTSGSTGPPKPVGIEHTALARHIPAARDYYAITPHDRVLAFASFSFDASLEQLLPALTTGAQVILRPDEQWLPAQLPALIHRHELTVANLPPAYWAELVSTLTPQAAAQMTTLRLLILGGETVPPSPLPAWTALAPHVTLLNAYGPTEAVITATTCNITRAATNRSIPIGRPLPARRIYITDPRGQLLPPGVPGELLIGGPALARGYLTHPALTAERFTPDPHTQDGTRLYHTGDLARWLPDGNLEYLGRTDNQIKIRGIRIEPGEIEAELVRNPLIAQAVVVAREHRPGDVRLISYLVPAPGTVGPDTTAVRTWLAARVPDYLIPSAFVTVPTIPRTPNGKIDHRALPPPQYPVSDTGRAPTTAVDSATRPRPPVVRNAGAAMIPLSFAQQRLWFLEQFYGPAAVHNLPLAWRLTGQLDVGALREALGDVAGRHESLRTVFAVADGQPYQRVIPAGQARTQIASGFTVAAAGRGELAGLVAAAAGHVFDLAGELPFRASLIALADDEHVLVLLCHHTASDGGSMQVLLADLAAAYQARSEGRAPAWAPLPVQYGDYALWQRDLLGGDDGVLAEQIEYWRQALAGLPQELALPFDRPRPVQPSRRGGQVSWQLADPALHAALADLAREQQATVFMVLLSGLAVLLSRMGAGTDIPLGAPVAGRTDEAVHDLVGFFVNTLVLRADLSDDLGFAGLVGRVREIVLSAQACQDVPFERLVEVLNPARSPSRHPLFQVMIGEEVIPDEWQLPGLRVRAEPVPAVTAKFDLALAVREQHGDGGVPAGIQGSFEYAADLFDQATVRALAGRLTQLLRQAARDPGRPVSQLDPLTATERSSLLRGWNDTARPVPAVTLHGLFEQQAARTPHAPAVTDGGAELTYAELNERANQLARYLISLGAGTGRLVAIAMPRSPGMITAVLAVLKSGAGYLPVDPAYPADRIGFMLAESVPVVMLTAAAVAAGLAGGPPVLVLDDPATAAVLAAGQGGQNLPGAAGPRDVAYVIYTSGSTGRPKGVVVEHAGVVSLACWAAATFGAGELSRVLASTSLSFDVSVFEIFGTLAAGGCLEVVPNLLALAERGTAGPWRGSLISAVPSALAQVLAIPGVRAQAQVAALCGEALTEQVIAVIRAAVPGARIENIYGPVEATVYATTYVVPPGSQVAAPPIGRPIWNTRVYVLDEGLGLVPPGVAGEMYLAGAGLARGYLGRPGLTAERFIPCSYGGAGERMYRTGDLARWNSDGQLEYLGRSDDQVKVRGFRIELGEVEAVLAGLPGVARAVVAVQEDQSGDKRLAGYVVPAAGAVLDPAGLREACGRTLPGYMVPSAVVVLGRLPLNANGKLDRRALPAPDYPGSSTRRHPTTAGEKALCDLFAEVLGRDSVLASDDFFDLGGHSLRVGHLLARVQDVFGASVTFGEFFGHPTPAQLAVLVEELALAQLSHLSEEDLRALLDAEGENR